MGTSAACIADIMTFVPFPRKYWPLVTAPANELIANCAVVCPVPPLAIANVPANVIVPDEVIGPPEVVKPVVPPDTATDVTVPELVVIDVFVTPEIRPLVSIVNTGTWVALP